MITHLIRALALGMLGLVATSMLQAHDFGGNTSGGTSPPPPEPPPCEDTCTCEGPGGGPKGGKGGSSGPKAPDNRSDSPISYWNGSESLTETDLSVVGVMTIAITRKYDSLSTYDSPLGFGWAFMHDRRLYEYPDGSVVVRHGCGMRDRYLPAGGSYVPPVGGVLGTLVHNLDGSWDLRYNNGSRDVFDSIGRLVLFEDRHGNKHEFTYDSRGKLPLTGTSKASTTPTQPMVVAYNYRLTRIDERGVDGTLTGNYVTFQYNETTGRLTSVTANDGRSISYSHDTLAGLTKGNLVAVAGLAGVSRAYEYNDAYDSHNLTSIIQAPGRTPVVNTYDDQDRVIRQEEGTRKIEFTYQVPLTKTRVTKTIRDPNGLNPYTAVTTYDFDPSGRITKITDALGHEQRFTYNALKLLERKELWQKSGSTLSLLQAQAWAYDTEGKAQTESVTLDSGEIVTRTWTYDHGWLASEQVVSSVAPSKIFRTEYTFIYGANGQPRAIASMKRRKDDGSFQITSYTYDTRNRLLTTTLPDGVKVVNEYTGEHVSRIYVEVGGAAVPNLDRHFEYNARGELIKRWDARGNLWQLTYDERSRVTSITNPLGEQTLLTYTSDLLSQVEAGRTVADGEGQVTRYIYDPRGRRIAVERKNDAGSFITFTSWGLDSESQVVSSTDAVNRTSLFGYNVLGQLTSATDPANRQRQLFYDAAGNRTRVRDAAGRDKDFEYDDLNRHIATIERGVTPNLRTEVTYDAASNITSVRDPKLQTIAYAYDALSRNTRATQPLGQYVQYVYDERDRIDYLINSRGNKIDFDYETWGPQKTARHFATASSPTPVRTIDFEYDLDGNLTAAIDDAIQASPAYVMTYDTLSRPYNETVKYLPGGDRVLQRRYDRFGNRKELTYQDGGPISDTYTYNKLNQLTAASLNGAAIAIQYYANDDRQTITLPNGVSRTYAYESNGPVSSITVAGPGGTIAQYSYAYDALLNVDAMTDQDGLHDYAYDGVERLTATTRPIGSALPNESYSYDAAGNREDPGNSALYNYDANNRISASPGISYTSDADGNIASRSDGAAFTHDAANRMAQFSKAGVSATYLYDPFGRRIRKTVGSVVTWFSWDGNSITAEYDGAGARTKRYAYLPGDAAPTQVADANGEYSVHADHLDTPRVLTGSAGQVVWQARFEAFGKAVVEADPDGNAVTITLNLRLPGQYFDSESGLHQNYHRDYDPGTGRYVQADPIGVRGGLNLYVYAGNNPTGIADPLGLTPKCSEVPGLGGTRTTSEFETTREIAILAQFTSVLPTGKVGSTGGDLDFRNGQPDLHITIEIEVALYRLTLSRFQKFKITRWESYGTFECTEALEGCPKPPPRKTYERRVLDQGEYERTIGSPWTEWRKEMISAPYMIPIPLPGGRSPKL